MKMKFVEDFDDKRKAGYEVTVDKIRYAPGATGSYVVRVVSEWKRPQWLAIGWFIHPNTDEN